MFWENYPERFWDKLHDGIRFKANSCSESESRNTWKFRLLSLITVYNPNKLDSLLCNLDSFLWILTVSSTILKSKVSFLILLIATYLQSHLLISINYSGGMNTASRWTCRESFNRTMSIILIWMTITVKIQRDTKLPGIDLCLTDWMIQSGSKRTQALNWNHRTLGRFVCC